MIILGIDPGYAIMGWGVIRKTGSSYQPLAYGAVTTDKDTPMPERLKHLYSGLMDVISEYQPEEASIEKLYFNTNVTTAIGVGEARGVAILACANSGLGIFEYTPLEIKTSLTGFGRAEKKQVQSMVTKILRLENVPKPDDVADALAAALTHAYSGEARKRLNQVK
ncbi:MAG: crossover junction endodeoxyribonuclease RuvC [Firmicutes bacterium]|nr:crossover junction endodeoxyribonuclease RuvC [Bacillota bacterium]MBR6351004.1 crossover junction endodeoxyribonuclease RuvC [Bacillota bacterium]